METPKPSIVLDAQTKSDHRTPVACMSPHEWKQYMKSKANEHGIAKVSPGELQDYILTNAEIYELMEAISNECRNCITSLTDKHGEESPSVSGQIQKFINKWTLLLKKASSQTGTIESKPEYISLLGNEKDENLLYAHFDDIVIPSNYTQDTVVFTGDCDPVIRSLTTTTDSKKIEFTHDFELNEKAIAFLLDRFHLGFLEICLFQKEVKYILKPKKRSDQKE